MFFKSVLAVSFLAFQIHASHPTPASFYDLDLMALQKREEICGTEDVVYNTKKDQCSCTKPNKITAKEVICPPPIHDTRGIATCEDKIGCNVYCFGNFVQNNAGDDCVCHEGMTAKNGKCHCKAGYITKPSGSGCKECKNGKVPNKKGDKCVHPPSGTVKRAFERNEFIFSEDSQYNVFECGPEGINCNSILGAARASCVSGQCVIAECFGSLTKTKVNGRDACE